MMKYKLFRSPGDLDKSVLKHELVAVETGKSIDDVADALIRAVRDDLAEMPEYAHCETAAYDWRFSPGSIWRFSPGANKLYEIVVNNEVLRSSYLKANSFSVT